jgi:hypothetical protein
MANAYTYNGMFAFQLARIKQRQELTKMLTPQASIPGSVPGMKSNNFVHCMTR